LRLAAQALDGEYATKVSARKANRILRIFLL